MLPRSRPSISRLFHLRTAPSARALVTLALAAAGGCSEETAPPPVIGPDPVTVAPLTTDPTQERAAAWSPDGTHIAFASNRHGPFFNLYVLELASLAVERLTTADADHSFPSWSPGGDYIVFDSTENEDLYIVSASGDSVRPLYPSPTSVQVSPAWAPDSSRIAFASNAVHPSYDLFVAFVDRDSLGLLTRTAYLENDPAWSPDGNRLAFRSDIEYFDDNIWIVDFRDSTVVVVAPLPPGEDLRPTWSPDGNYLAWASDRSGNREIWAIDVRGGVPVPITLNAALDTAPAWSPDGETIAFTSDRSGNFDIWLATDLDSVLATSTGAARAGYAEP